MKKLIVLLIFILSSLGLPAQSQQEVTESDYTNQEVEMADKFRAEGKIYVLTGVILLILGGIFMYLVVIDRKVARMEKQLPNDGTEKPF